MYCCSAQAQYYITGEVLDEDKKPIQNVKIYMPATRAIYSSGISGGFGIPSSHLQDSLVLTKLGFDSLKVSIKTKEYQKLTLKKSPAGENPNTPKLVSLTKGIEGAMYPASYYKGESYSNLVENDFIKTNKNYNTSFSMRIDKAAYSNVRRFINQETKVPPDAVRIDELLNYFNFNYKEPAAEKDFHISSQLTDCPWNDDHMLLYMNVSARKLKLDKVPPSNFVYLIDVSGSMDQPSRLPLLKEAFQLLIKNLRDQDTVSIVVYGGFAGIWLNPTGGAEKDKISKSIEELNAWGDTPGEAAIRMAYQLAKQTFIKNGNNRIILATGGDFINPASIAFYDAPMLVNELYSMDIHPELVVLSACETGIGKLQKGEGPMSIARGFQYAGAKNILFSLWQINDASTATLMSLFYKSYKKTQSAHSANRRSKLDYLQDKSVSNIKKSPYYWSAFMYYGKIEEEERKSTAFYYFIGSLAFIIGLFLWLRKRKTKDGDD